MFLIPKTWCSVGNVSKWVNEYVSEYKGAWWSFYAPTKNIQNPLFRIRIISKINDPKNILFNEIFLICAMRLEISLSWASFISLDQDSNYYSIYAGSRSWSQNKRKVGARISKKEPEPVLISPRLSQAGQNNQARTQNYIFQLKTYFEMDSSASYFLIQRHKYIFIGAYHSIMEKEPETFFKSLLSRS